jgi:hypothetical protein
MYHPDAKIRVYTNTLELQSKISKTIAVELVKIDESFFSDTPLKSWWLQNAKYELPKRQGSFFYSHLSDAIRLAALYKHGGVYMDFDILLLHPIRGRNVFGLEDRKQHNLAVAAFDDHHPFIFNVMSLFMSEYNPACWACVGPKLATKAVHLWITTGHSIGYVTNVSSFQTTTARKLEITIASQNIFYPVMWQGAKKLHGFYDTYDKTLHQSILNSSITFHVWSKMSSGKNVTSGSTLHRLLLPYCDEPTRQGQTCELNDNELLFLQLR